MKTSAILTPPGIAQNLMAKPAQNGAGEANLPFRQVLSERRENAQQSRNQAGKSGSAGGAASGPGTPDASNEQAPEKADPAENPLSADDTATSQLLALAAQLAQFNAIGPEVPADGLERNARGGQLPTASARPDTLPATRAAQDPAAKDAFSLLAADNAPLDADPEHQPGAAGKNLELRTGMTAAALASAQQGAAERTQEIQTGMLTPAGAPAQQIAAGQAQAAAAPLADRIAPQVGSKGWDQAFAQRVVWMVAGAQQSASLTLNPPDLGPLQVVLNVSNAQATANFIAAQPEVRQALETAMPRLREMLEEAGIQLGQANVSAGNPQQQGTFEQRPRGSASSGHPEVAEDTLISTTPRNAQMIRQGLVDTFA